MKFVETPLPKFLETSVTERCAIFIVAVAALVSIWLDNIRLSNELRFQAAFESLSSLGALLILVCGLSLAIRTSEDLSNFKKTSRWIAAWTVVALLTVIFIPVYATA